MGEPKKDDLQEFLNELESEGSSTPAPAPAAAQTKPELRVVEGGGADLEGTLEGLKEEPAPDSLLDQELEKEIGEVMDTLKSTPKDGTLSLSLQGTMTLKLSYAQAGQNVTIRFEKDCLFVNLDNGTEFKIPVKA